MAVPRRRKYLNQSFLAGSPALDASYLSSLSKQNLKHVSKSYIHGNASAVFMYFPPGGRLHHDDYNLEQFTNLLISLKLPKQNSSFTPGFTNKELKDLNQPSKNKYKI